MGVGGGERGPQTDHETPAQSFTAHPHSATFDSASLTITPGPPDKHWISFNNTASSSAPRRKNKKNQKKTWG